jgi:hypothetical protein
MGGGGRGGSQQSSLDALAGIDGTGGGGGGGRNSPGQDNPLGWGGNGGSGIVLVTFSLPTPSTVVPEPVSIAVWSMMALFGLAFFGWNRWRR